MTVVDYAAADIQPNYFIYKQTTTLRTIFLFEF